MPLKKIVASDSAAKKKKEAMAVEIKNEIIDKYERGVRVTEAFLNQRGTLLPHSNPFPPPHLPIVSIKPARTLHKVVAGKFQFSIPHPEVAAPQHSDVLLPCIFANSRIELKDVLIVWRHDDAELIKFDAGQMNPTSRRVQLFVNEIERGNASLLLKDVIISDEGQYECGVVEAPNEEYGSIKFKVTVAPQVILNASLFVMDQPGMLECHAEGFYPRDISIKWFRGATSLPFQEAPQVRSNPDGTFSVLSVYKYTPSGGTANETVSCQVDHDSRNVPWVKMTRLQFHKRPSVTVTSQVLGQNKEQLLTCRLDGHYPDDIVVTWMKNGKALNKSELKGDGTYVTTESILLTSFNEKDNFACLVEQEGFKDPLTKIIPIEMEGGNSQSAITALSVVVGVLLILVLTLLCVVFLLIKRNALVF
ncbi:tyrosine-protein phosphatase non-receptor type substrate 1-like isoform X2 [Polypterus senegalus]|uniref:tyrosine-protein phosphatase non-receptor type substrate 1-like isoform X2 n=1 Tax=Polypterus senegalus TaxID=55291 RepID=UPI001963713D|nr:tyrosine-protein phosphatase non-receptor type substrate 1-like isoform X2 [Polypterus senegalus]